MPPVLNNAGHIRITCNFKTVLENCLNPQTDCTVKNTKVNDVSVVNCDLHMLFTFCPNQSNHLNKCINV